MEAALVSGLLKLAAGRLVPLIGSEFASLMGAKKHLCELQCLFGEINSRLSAFGDKVTDSDPSFYWLKDLKDVAYDFDDLLYHLEAEKHKADMGGRDKHVMAYCFCAKPEFTLSRLEVVHEIKKIKKRFAVIVKQRADINALANGLVVRYPVQHINKIIGEMSILVNIDGTKVFGRDDVKHKIVSKLVDTDSQDKISVISIVGLGGSGKTTLAKYICLDNKIDEYFEVTWWVHVSQEFNVEKLIGKLFESVADKKSEFHTLQHMSRTILEKLSGRKFLLVLDDVWNGDQHDWEQFEQHFNSGAPGSKILLTTRDGNIAEAVKSTVIFSLAFLSDDDSWKLFQQSSGWAEEGLNSEFIEVGKEIVKKCAGVPLAIKSLGGVLRDKREIREWRALRESNLLNDLDIKDRILGSLRLSYFHLSDSLKQCFVLCSIFPKGYFIYKDHLISQWIAHGFVNSVNEGQIPEDVGSDYFDSLLKVSFLQDLVEDRYTGRLLCKMHDLVHDLTRQILQDEIILTPKKKTNDYNQRCRYLSLVSCTEKVDRKLFNKVRALYVTGGSCATDKPIEKGCCVRSVILEYIRDTSVPLFVLKFEYLGYLRISSVLCRELPEAITGCWNLQALHVIHCIYLAVLPESIGKLRKLRTLELSWALDLRSLPESLGDCHSLESLHLISCLKFSKIPESLRKNGNLRLLYIFNCRSLVRLPSESFGMLRKLQTIDLSECESLEDLPSSFSCYDLRTLKLSMVRKLTILPHSISSLSNLEHLDLRYCSELVELPEGIRNLKRLEVLNLEGCYKLHGLPAGLAELTRLRRLSLFTVGDSTYHARISELGNLDMISGTLEIMGIRYVKNPEDAEKACLKNKINIQKLVLVSHYLWNSSAKEETDMEQELAVLNSLEPPSGIKELEIHGYKGPYFPHWLTNEGQSCSLGSISKKIVDLPYFPHLISMKLEDFPKYKHLTGLIELPLLKTLRLSRFNALESISAGPFPSLTELDMSWMDHLLELSTTTRITTLANEDGVTACRNQGVHCCFPRLSTLNIWGCPKLHVRPCFPASLESLTLFRSNEELLFPAPCISFNQVNSNRDEAESLSSCSHNNGTSSCSSLLRGLKLQRMTGPSSSSGWELLTHLNVLESLEIVGCSEMRQFPESMRSLTALQQLEISTCDFRMLPEWLGELCSLQRLKISYCIDLMNFPEGIQHLTSLQELHIQGCHALHQLPEVGLGELRSLCTLWVQKLPSLSCLPESIRGLTSLQELYIEGCDALHHLPEGLGELRSLRKLSIFVLPGLSCLPGSMQGLTSLEELIIDGCGTLRCLPDELGKLCCLQTLSISNLPCLTCLPESMHRLISLLELVINCCYALTSLPESIGRLSALRVLIARDCFGLTSLPRSIQHLTALQKLCITGNPHLARCYNQGKGKDWHLICHIPQVEMDYMEGC